MTRPKRKYNLATCGILSVIGAFFGALVISGLIFPFTAYILDLLPSGNWGIPPEIFTVVCRGGLLLVPIALLVIWLVTSRPHISREKQLKKRAKLDEEVCLGCGLCVRACPQDNIRLKSRPKRVITPLNGSHRAVVMAIERGQLQDLIFDNRVLWSHRALAAVVGHIFPVWHRFRGGRGVATALGAVLYLEPWFGLILVVGWGTTVVMTKTASIASLGAMVLYVPGYALFGWRGWPLAAAGLTAALVVIRHSGNIRRLLGGSEQTVETQ